MLRHSFYDRLTSNLRRWFFRTLILGVLATLLLLSLLPGADVSGKWIPPAPTATRAAITTTATSTVTRTPASPGITPTRTRTRTATASVQAWNGNFVAYSLGQLVSYNGATYRCIQAHTSQPNWNPEAVPALWQRL